MGAGLEQARPRKRVRAAREVGQVTPTLGDLDLVHLTVLLDAEAHAPDSFADRLHAGKPNGVDPVQAEG
jgi:hypothetical protein